MGLPKRVLRANEKVRVSTAAILGQGIEKIVHDELEILAAVNHLRIDLDDFLSRRRIDDSFLRGEAEHVGIVSVTAPIRDPGSAFEVRHEKIENLIGG